MGSSISSSCRNLTSGKHFIPYFLPLCVARASLSLRLSLACHHALGDRIHEPDAALGGVPRALPSLRSAFASFDHLLSGAVDHGVCLDLTQAQFLDNRCSICYIMGGFPRRRGGERARSEVSDDLSGWKRQVADVSL